MDQADGGRPIPEDARQATEQQEELQDEFDRRGEDPEAPGQHESREQIADET
ncbi:hypothetical protein [Mycolicibacterium goodii]|uniref:Uncharacterized protein n=1 Tax=Mycolicibacterium goodii TaxID=134601 RepID=A0ABS6HM22_MYCGD|nr:hypothetical protein [Mycolicibacterium goodii]MBU8810888.1 hypothetical protein [Mycolicibacterium goodii]MBU8816048.1 hypothetical protein [Mycolicibacterium goodii]MBU8823671.1 hypothetical protein [Mycolicibacterium goodii]MBU8831601.1 hypothetical protein [Mycolicibacterium goodii]MBU8835842.1 hypothetical protein [Mycolicibacterium goodii]